MLRGLHRLEIGLWGIELAVVGLWKAELVVIGMMEVELAEFGSVDPALANLELLEAVVVEAVPLVLQVVARVRLGEGALQLDLVYVLEFSPSIFRSNKFVACAILRQSRHRP
jgi:hypothetical protein